MKKNLLLIFCFMGLSVSFAQPVLKPSIGIGPLPKDTDKVCHIPFYLGGSAASGYHVGDTVADFTVYNLNGDSLNLYTALSTGKPALLISGSYTCPITRGNIASINNVVATYGSQINVYLIYIVEVHPAIDSSPYFAAVNTNPVNIAAGILYRQPTTYGERKAMVTHFLDSMTINAPIYIDGPCNNWWLKYGPAQNNATLIRPNGTVFAKHAWYNRAPDHIMCDIDSLLGNPVTCQPAGMFTYNFLSTDTVRGNAGNTISFNGTLVNNSAHNVTVKIARKTNDIPPGWSSAICLNSCDTVITDTVSRLLIPGASQPFQFNYYTTAGVIDTGYVRMRFWNDDDANNKINQNFYGITSVTPPPSAFTISGATGFCRSTTNNIYSTSISQSGVTYYWTFPAGATIVSGQGTSTVSVNYSSTAVAGNINVTASNMGGSANAIKTLMLRTKLPATPGTITGSNTGCNGDVKTFSIRKVASADYYIWTPPFGATIKGSVNPVSTTDTIVTVTYTASFIGDTLRVKSVNCVGMGAEKKLRINRAVVIAPKTISGTTIGLCNQSNKTYSISAVSNAVSYNWRTNIANATINGSTSPVTTTSLSVNVDFGSFVSGQLYVKANNNCMSSAEKALTLNAKPAAPTSIIGPVTVCDAQLGVGYSTPLIANASAYNWALPSGATIATGQNTPDISVNFGATPLTGNVRVRSQNSCATSAYYNLSVTINNCARVSNETTTENLLIMPNPFSTSATLVLPEGTDLSASEIVIYNVLGAEQRRISNLNNYIIELQKENLPVGIYVLQLYSHKTLAGSVRMIID